MKTMKWKLLTVLILLAVSIASIAFSNNKRGEEKDKMISFSAKKLRDVYRLGESMPVEIKFKNNTKYPIKFTKPFPIEEKSLFAIKIDKKDLAKITDERMKRNLLLPHIITLIDPSPKDIVILKPTEEYKTEINIAELVKELELKPGTYKARIIYTMWFSILKEKPEYAKNAKGKTREWESSEIKITLK